MVEPVSITLAALALLDPAIQSVRKAYGVYRLTTSFGEHYTSTQRKLDGEQARLEMSLDTNLASMPDKKVLTQIIDHLGHLEKHFQGCQDLIASIEGHRGRGQLPLIRNDSEKVLTINKDVVIQTARQRLLTWFPKILDPQLSPLQNVASRSPKFWQSCFIKATSLRQGTVLPLL